MGQLLHFESSALDDLPKIASQIIDQQKNMVLLFTGDLGAGKTTLIKEICRQLGVADLITSPTFSLVNEYENDKGETIFHFDFYRLDHPDEALDMGWYEYVDSDNRCLVEWPEKILRYLPEDFDVVEIEALTNGNRKITLVQDADRTDLNNYL